MPRLFCFISVLFLASPSVTAEIFKCSGPDGKTVYQNFRCEIDSIGSSATAAPPPPEAEKPVPVIAPEPAKRNKASIVASDSPTGMRTEPRIGMTRKEVRASTWGEPIDIVGEEVVEGWTYSWYYDLQKKRSVLFDVGGRVSEVTR